MDRESVHTIRVVVADDHDLTRAEIASLLDHSEGISIVGEAANGAEAIHVTLATHADVVLLDVLMPVLDGVAATRQLLQAHDRSTLAGGTAPRPAVVMLTDRGADEYVYESLRDGARGFVSKNARPAELAMAVRTAADDSRLVWPAETVRLIASLTPDRGGRPDIARARSGLSTGDAIVVVGVGRGDDDEQIARNLGIGVDEVQRRIRSLLLMLALRDRTQLVVFAYESGLLTPKGVRAPR